MLKQMDNFDFFGPNLTKNGIRVGNSKHQSENKNQHLGDALCANFQTKERTLTFSAQIYSKINLGLQIHKTNVEIRISILEIPCVPIFTQNGQL